MTRSQVKREIAKDVPSVTFCSQTDAFGTKDDPAFQGVQFMNRDRPAFNSCMARLGLTFSKRAVFLASLGPDWQYQGVRLG